MANLSITAANFLPSANAVYEVFVAGATISRGQLYYLDASDSYKAKLAIHNGTAAQANVRGIASVDVSSGQIGRGVIKDPALAVGATVAVGQVLGPSATAGAVADYADAGSADFPNVTAVGVSTTEVNFDPLEVGAAIA